MTSPTNQLGYIAALNVVVNVIDVPIVLIVKKLPVPGLVVKLRENVTGLIPHPTPATAALATVCILRVAPVFYVGAVVGPRFITLTSASTNAAPYTDVCVLKFVEPALKVAMFILRG